MKIVINKNHGSFELSHTAITIYAQKKGLNLKWEVTNNNFGRCFYYLDDNRTKYFNERQIERDDLVLVEIIETMGEKADGISSKLKVVEIPDYVQWEIEECRGAERVVEKYRSWQ